MTKLSLFKNSFTQTPSGFFTLEEFIEKIRDGFWRKEVDKLRSKKEEKAFKKYKQTLPAITVSGDFKTRDNALPLNKRLRKHSGYIAIDIDKKDNPKMRAADIVDAECTAQFVSCSGHGKKIIYRCTPVEDAEQHRRIFDAITERLSKKGIKLKVDPIVKSIASMQYVSYDEDAYYNPETKLVIKPLPAIKKKEVKPTDDTKKTLTQLQEYIDALGKTDITSDYENWMNVLFGLSYTLGESGRKAAHDLSKNYSGYSKLEVDEKFDAILEQSANKTVDNPITISTVYKIIGEFLPKATFRALSKKYNISHAVGVGEDEEQSDLNNKVRYRLFLFEKIKDKEGVLVDLKLKEVNLNAFEQLLRNNGFYKFEKEYIHIVNNVVERVDLHDIIRLITDQIEKEGNYSFTYKGTQYNFPWEELVYLWRKTRALSTTYNQIATGVPIWQPDLLRDSATTSYIPYQNGVLVVTAKTAELQPYSKLTQQIWKERILPRDFKRNRYSGMFEDFFTNVMGRGDTQKAKRKSKEYFNALWCFGYMLQGYKRMSNARAWLLYDLKAGNNGRSGKSLIMYGAGQIRSMVTIDGKRTDLNDRFAFQRVQPWTDIVFIDDPKKYTSLIPLFNVISGSLEAEKKQAQSFDVRIKVAFASNWIMETEGESEVGRQFTTQLDDYYVRYAKEHNNTIQPIIDVHGKEFFTDWDEKDWSQFDSFCADALKYHLSNDAPENKITGNVKLLRFVQQHDEDLFFQLALCFKQHLIKGIVGYAISQALLSTIVIDIHGNLSPIKANRVVREFLLAIGIQKTTRTSMIVNSSTKMMIKFENDPYKLDFGEFQKQLPNYKNLNNNGK